MIMLGENEMARAIMLTVGTGTRPDSNIVAPLVKSIRHVSPERVVLLVTDGTGGSRPHGEAIREQIDASRTQSTLMPVPDLDDLEQTFQCCLEALRGLEQEGFAANDIVAEYTSGTKAMTAGLALAASSFGCGSLNYVTGRREHGVVVEGTEKLLSVPTAFFRAHHDLTIARHLFERLQFSAVLELLPEWRVHLLGDQDGATLFALRALAHAYDAWDKFEHATFVERFALAQTALESEMVDPRVREHVVSEDVVSRIGELAATIEAPERRKRFHADQLADLWNNAHRRMESGSYDDAVARLYRLVEMTAQYEFDRTFGINTSNVRFEQLREPISDGLRAELEHARSQNGKKTIKIGLQTAYRLLGEQDSPLGRAYVPDSEGDLLSGLLTSRNQSILAHGQTPVEKAVAAMLLVESTRLVTVVVPDFEERCYELQFPWLRDRTTSSE